MPPQHAKTELGPRLGGAYWLTRNPGSWGGICSYASDKANARSFDARNYYQRGGGQVMHGAGSVNEWRTLNGGGFWSAGVAAGQAGQPMILGIADDLDYNLADAIGARQEKKRNWYRETWRARESLFGDAYLRQLMSATRLAADRATDTAAA